MATSRLEEPYHSTETDEKEFFQCFCGQRFEKREVLDGHLKEFHPDMLWTCGDCGRLLPKGVWKKSVDENVLILVPN